MPNRSLTSNDAHAARRAIEDAFVAQCLQGRQTDVLPEGVVACGQFLDDPSRNQRGLHGTAAAIRVLSCASGDRARGAVAGLVRYLEDRDEHELAAVRSIAAAEANLERDLIHTVKTAEILHALSFVGAGTITTHALVVHYAEQLLSGATQEGGWGFFLGKEQRFALLPTAHAVRALARHKYDVEPYVSKLRGAATRAESAEGAHYVQIFALMALAEIGGSHDPLDQAAFRRLWERYGDELDRDREARVNLPRPEGPHAYVGVPWQLYLAKLALLSRSSVSGPASASLAKLGVIADRMRTEGLFRYPDSGEEVSTRTNGILYDVLAEAENAAGGSSLVATLTALRHGASDLLRRPRGRHVIGAITGAVIVATIFAWVLLDVAAGVAASLVAAALVSLLGWSVRSS